MVRIAPDQASNHKRTRESPAQTTFTTSDPLPEVNRDEDMSDHFRLDHVIAHFVVRADGTILYVHDIQYHAPECLFRARVERDRYGVRRPL
jgi:hypothetical protein